MTKAGNIVVDTSAIISLFRGHESARECFNTAQEIGLPVTVLAELYCGLRKGAHFTRIEGLELIEL